MRSRKKFNNLVPKFIKLVINLKLEWSLNLLWDIKTFTL